MPVTTSRPRLRRTLLPHCIGLLLAMPRADFIAFFEAQGLEFSRSRNVLQFPGADSDRRDFIEGLFGDRIEGFRVWRRP